MSSRLAAINAASRAKKAAAAPASTSAGASVPSPTPISIIPPRSVPETITIPSDETEGSKVVRDTDKKKKRKEKEVEDTRPRKKIRASDKPSDVEARASGPILQIGGDDILEDDDLALRVFEDIPLEEPIYQKLLDKDVGLYAELARTEVRSLYLTKVLRQALAASFDETKRIKSEIGTLKKGYEDRILEIETQWRDEIRSQADNVSNALKFAEECGKTEKMTLNKLRESELEADKLKSEVAKLTAEVAKSTAEISELKSRPSEAEVIKSFTEGEAYKDALAAAKLEGEIATFDDSQDMFRKAVLRLDPAITEARLNEAVDAELEAMEASKNVPPAP